VMDLSVVGPPLTSMVTGAFGVKAMPLMRNTSPFNHRTVIVGLRSLPIAFTGFGSPSVVVHGWFDQIAEVQPWVPRSVRAMIHTQYFVPGFNPVKSKWSMPPLVR